MNAIVKILLYMALVIVIVMVAYWNNDQTVDVRYLPGRTFQQVPVFLVILSSMFLGVLVAGVIAAVEHFRHGMRERDLKRAIAALESEVRELRNLPLSDGLTDGDEGTVQTGWVEE